MKSRFRGKALWASMNEKFCALAVRAFVVPLTCWLCVSGSPVHAAEYVVWPTKEQCRVILAKGGHLPEVSWSGKCVDGMAGGAGKQVYTWKNGESAETWEYLKAGSRPFEDGPVYYYSESRREYLVMNSENDVPQSVTEEACRSVSRCREIHSVRAGINAPKGPAPKPSLGGTSFPPLKE
jgi:hypothetical protein